jgi:hypothetical protein
VTDQFSFIDPDSLQSVPSTKWLVEGLIPLNTDGQLEYLILNHTAPRGHSRTTQPRNKTLLFFAPRTRRDSDFKM